MKLLLSILLCTIIRHSLSASFDPYTGEEIVEAVEGSDEYEYYSDGEGYDGYEYETEAAAVEEQEYIPPGYLAPSVPTAVLIFKPILNNKFIEDVSEHYNCLPQKDMMTSNILDLKKKGQDVDPAPVPEEAPPRPSPTR